MKTWAIRGTLPLLQADLAPTVTATLATYTPEFDRDDKTLRLALRLIELVGESAADSQESAPGQA